MNVYEQSLLAHKKTKGKLAINSKMSLETSEDLTLAYTPGVAAVCQDIAQNPENAYNLTCKANMVMVVTDGSAVLGLGNIGPLASLPVMEGKAVLFKRFAGVDAFPILINSQNVDEFVKTVELISLGFGGINLEDISAPRCFEIEKKLKQLVDIPVFHDDQQGTAITCAAGLINSLKIVEKNLKNIKIVISGAGAAGIAVCKFLLKMGVQNIIASDIDGLVFENRSENDNWALKELGKITNKEKMQGGLKEALKNADVFIGVSVSGLLTEEMVKSMAPRAIVFALANPEPEIMPHLALKAGAEIVATGRSDFDNQLNNCLVFPAVFKGALEVRASEINFEMMLAAAEALAGMLKFEELKPSYILPKALDARVAAVLSKAVSQKAIETKVNRI